MITRVPGTVWKCEHCGALRENDGKCKHCGALEQPRLPADVPRMPIRALPKIERARQALRNARERFETSVKPGMMVLGGEIKPNVTTTFNLIAMRSMCPQFALMVRRGGPYMLSNLVFGNRLQWDYETSIHSDAFEMLGYTELHGDAVTCGTPVQVTITNLEAPGYCYLYLHGPAIY